MKKYADPLVPFFRNRIFVNVMNNDIYFNKNFTYYSRQLPSQ